MHKINCSAHFALFCTIFLVLLGANPTFSKTLVWHEWKADSQTKGGKTVACFLQLAGLTSDSIPFDPKPSRSTLTTANLTLTLVEKSDRKWLSFGVKVTGTRILEDFTTHAIPIHYAWVQSSTGSTVNQITQLETAPNKYYLGGLAGDEGLDLFLKIFKGILEDGLVVGWQESPGKLDKRLKVKDPPSPDKLLSFNSCMGQLGKNYQLNE